MHSFDELEKKMYSRENQQRKDTYCKVLKCSLSTRCQLRLAQNNR